MKETELIKATSFRAMKKKYSRHSSAIIIINLQILVLTPNHFIIIN